MPAKAKEKEMMGSYKKYLIEKDRIEIATNLLNLGVEIEKISKATNLSISKIEKIAKKIPKEI